MKKGLLVSALMAFMAMSPGSLNAQQVKLVVMPQGGGQTSEYALADIRRITFQGDGMHIVGSKFAVEPVWKLSAIKKLLFTGSPAGIEHATLQETGKVTVTLRGNQLFVNGISTNQPSAATIFDVSGQIVVRTNVSNGEPIDASTLRNGIYIIKVNNTTLKFAKQ